MPARSSGVQLVLFLLVVLSGAGALDAADPSIDFDPLAELGLPAGSVPPGALDAPVPLDGQFYRSREEIAAARARGEQPESAAPEPARGWREAGIEEEENDHLERAWEGRPTPAAMRRKIEQAVAIRARLAPDPAAPGTAAEARGAAELSTAAWTPIGIGLSSDDGIHHRAGRVTELAYGWDPAQGLTTLWAGTSGGGVWKLVGAGILAFWVPVSDNLPGSPSVGAMLIDPAQSNRLLIGTGDNARYPGTGFYYSNDGGATWSASTMSPSNAVPGAIFSIRRSVSSSVVTVAATSTGIWYSSNRGSSWTRVDTRFATDIVQDPVSPQYWLAAAPGTGILESSNGATSFHTIQSVGGVQPTGSLGRISLALAASAPNYVYALIDDGSGSLNGIYRSADYGYHWTAIDSGDPISGKQGGHANAIAVHPANPDLLFVGMAGSQWTANATATTPCWLRAGATNCASACPSACFDGGHADYTTFTFVPAAVSPGNSKVLIGNDGGYYVYDYAARSLSGAGNLIGLNVSQTMQQWGSLAANRINPDLLLAGLQDNGVVRVDRNLNPIIRYLGGGDGGQVTLSPDDTTSWFISNGADFVRSYTANSGALWNPLNCSFGFEWTVTLLKDPTPGNYNEMFTYSEGAVAEVIGLQNLAATPLAQSETLTLTLNGVATAANLAAGDTITQIVTKVQAAANSAALGLKASSADGRLQVASIAAGDETTVKVSSNRGIGGGTAGFGAVGIQDTGADAFAAYKPVSPTCNWLPLHPTGFPNLPRFMPKQIDQAANTSQYLFYLTDWAGQRLIRLEGSTAGGLTQSDRTPPLSIGAGGSMAFADRFTAQPETVYYSANSANGSQLFLSTNGADCWREVTGNLATVAPGAQLWELVGNPSNLDQLFVATDVGVFRTDSGLDAHPSWFPYSEGLPAAAQIQGLELSTFGLAVPRLHLSTYGRGFWERQLGAATYLFADGFESGNLGAWSSPPGTCS